MRNQAIIIVVFFVLISIISPWTIFASPYGEGKYGSGNYNVGQVTSSSSSGGSGSSGPSVCNRQVPDSIPDFFQINAKKDSMTLFFTPSAGNRDRYFVSYGIKTSKYLYGFEFNNSEKGVISVDIGALQRNTIYYFKIRAGNGCQPGEWSNELAAKTGQWFPTYRWRSLPQVVTSGVTRTINPSSISHIKVDASTIESPILKQQGQEPKSGAKPQNLAQPTSAKTTQADGGIWNWFVNLFK